MPKPKPKPKQKKTAYAAALNGGRMAGIAAGSYVVGMVSIVLRPILWLLGIVLGFLQVAALCGAVALFVTWLVGRFQR